jgi:hypothetical protein
MDRETALRWDTQKQGDRQPSLELWCLDGSHRWALRSNRGSPRNPDQPALSARRVLWISVEERMRKHMRPSSLGSVLYVAAVGTMVVACSGTSGSGFVIPPADGGGGGNGSGGPGPGGGGPGPGMLGGDAGGGAIPDAATGDGPVDTTPACDTALAIDDSDAASFAKAIGICTTVAAQGFGLVSASYSRAFGSATPPHAGQWGLLPKFGSVITPREGATLGVLSSGYAREYDDAQGVLLSTPSATCMWSGIPGACPVGIASDFVNSSPDGPLDGTSYPTGAAPPGFPKAAQGCQQDNLINDMIDAKLVLKAPMDATGFQFDFDFYSSEWPNFVCSTFDDAFIAYLTSSATTDNVSFDSNNNPIAVNTNFFNRCTAGAPIGCNRTDNSNPDPPLATSTCAGGAGELDGTGYSDQAQTLCMNGADVSATLGGATGWLTTRAPIQPGEQFTIEFMIWDAGDGILDSSVLIDHFQWIGGATVTPGTGRPPS